jgi:PilZ domain
MNKNAHPPEANDIRFDLRYPQLVAALVSVNGGPRTECAILDLSAGGALALMPDTPVGALVLLDIPKFERRLPATVVSLGGEERVHLRFIGLTLAEQLRLAKVLEGPETSR